MILRGREYDGSMRRCVTRRLHWRWLRMLLLLLVGLLLIDLNHDARTSTSVCISTIISDFFHLIADEMRDNIKQCRELLGGSSRKEGAAQVFGELYLAV